MYPNADIPIIQLSLKNNLNAAEHIDMGRALRPLLSENVLIVGSGFSFHNMKAFFSPSANKPDPNNEAFEKWLVETCTSKKLSEDERRGLLESWSTAPAARYCHPREEHLLPLHVCYGVAQKASSQHFEVTILNKKASIYLWEA